MRYLKANTQVKVVIGPFVDVGDGFTPETGVTLAAADEAELIKHDAAAVTDISGNTWAAIANADGYYNLTLTTTDTNTEGMLVVVVQDDSVCLPVKAEFMVLAEAAYDSMFAAKDTGYMDVNVKAISEDEVAANNLETACDGGSYNLGGGGVVAASVAGAVGSVTGNVGGSVASVTAGVTLANGAHGGGAASLDMSLGITGSITGNLSGSVGSVTGAVGSVTGNVGGNVTGSVGSVSGHTPQTGDNFARLGAPAGASISADVAAVKADTGNLVTRITATLFTGITSLAEWLGLLAGKQAGNATARTELRATGAGSGTYDETADSQEAIRDRGDASWITATGFSTHSAADVNAEVLDVLNVDTLIDGKTIVAALKIVAAICGGKVSGAGTGTEVFKGLDGNTTRATVTVDEDGNRSAVTY